MCFLFKPRAAFYTHLGASQDSRAGYSY
ncbi:hypothetical protein ACUODJ_26085 [Escherichia sp. HC-CC]